MKFKTEEEKVAAMEAFEELGPEDAPVGKDVEEFMNEQEKKYDEILHAEIDSELEETPVENTDESNEKPSEDDATPPIEKKDPIEEPENKELELAKRRAENLEKQRDELLAENDSKFEELQNTIKELQSQIKKPEEEKADTEIDKIKNEISELERYMNSNDVDVMDDEYQIKSRKTNQLYMKLNHLLTTRTENLYKEQKQEREELALKQKKKKEEQAKEDNAKKIGETIDSFREGIPELEGRKYDEMAADYDQFAYEIAAEFYTKPMNKITPEETEIAMQKYLNKSPILLEHIEAKGIKVPEDLNQFIRLSEINALKMGYKLNKKTGQWDPITDYRNKQVVFPNHKSALNHLKEENGDYLKELMAAEKKVADNLVQTISKRSPAVELDEDHKGVDIESMTEETARNIIEKYDEESIALRARRNFNDPLVSEYNKALTVLNYATITPQDVE